MKIFIDEEFRCHVSDDGSMREFEVPFFDGKCKEFIEGYRYVPQGESWTRGDGIAFGGEMTSPWKDYSRLEAIQTAADRILNETDTQLVELLDIIEQIALEG